MIFQKGHPWKASDTRLSSTLLKAQSKKVRKSSEL